MMPDDRDVIIDVTDLRMRYGANDVLRGVTFQARRGEVLGLLGPNGAGKTTTIEILEGFRRRSAGTVRVLGMDPANATEDWRAKVGIVLQSWRDHGKWRVRELLDYFGRYYTPYATALIPRPWDSGELLAAVGLAELANRKVATLSGGQRRRLDVAVGIIGRPEVLFLDEPTAGFDAKARREFHELVRRLAEQQQTTILLTTHDLGEAEVLANRVVILAGGLVVADGTISDLERLMVVPDEVRWVRGGQHCVQSTTESTSFAFQLFREHGAAISNLEVRRSSLEDTYLALVRRAESAESGREQQARQQTVA